MEANVQEGLEGDTDMGKILREHLTDTSIKRAAAPATGEAFLWDSDCPGLAVRIFPSGRKVYCVQYRMQDGKHRRRVIGVVGKMKVDAARREASPLCNAARAGKDPAGDRITVGKLWEQWRKMHGIPRKKVSSQLQDAIYWGEPKAQESAPAQTQPAPDADGDKKEPKPSKRRYPSMREVFGKKRVAALTRGFIMQWHTGMTEAPYTANRCLALLSTMLSFAVKMEYRSDNPCLGVEKFKEEPRKTRLSADELARIGAALVAVEKQKPNWTPALNAMKLLILTGLRKSEILNARWEHCDLERGMLHLPDSKTGKRDVPLNTPARELLAAMGAKDEGYVIPSAASRSGRWVNLRKVWLRVCATAGLSGIRIHDTRHAFASMLADSGESLLNIAALLGHAETRTTEKYSHVDVDPARAASEKAGKHIADTWSKVTPLPAKSA